MLGCVELLNEESNKPLILSLGVHLIKEGFGLFLELLDLLHSHCCAVHCLTGVVLLYLLLQLMQRGKLLAEPLNLDIRAVLRPVNQFPQVNGASIVNLSATPYICG